MGGYFYLLASYGNTTVYKGSTDDIIRRVYEHKNHLDKGSFTDKYNVTKLVYFEYYEDIRDARSREKQIEKWSRMKKNKLINKLNPEWRDLYWEII